MTTAAVKNAVQRKLAVMKRCDAIKPDKTHPAHKYEYNSIQNISNHLRTFLAEEGLDCQPSIEGGEMVVTLVNADNPEDRIVSRWPIVDGDRGWAYTTKYPLVRIFLIGDGEENDETDMANNSAEAARRRAAAGSGSKTPKGPEGPPDNPKPPEHELDNLYSLAGNLPDNPKPREVIDDLLRKFPYDTLLTRIVAEHGRQCGENCKHLHPVAAAAADNGKLPL